MIFPSKHIRLSESLFGHGAPILMLLNKPRTIDQLWLEIDKKKEIQPVLKNISFETMVLTLDFLFTIRAINIDSKSRISHAAH